MTHFGQSDASASYLASFHGKAMQLGSQNTASCLDCHAAQWADIHIMKSRKDTDSPTNPDHLPDTCRSPACHPTAGYAISTAAIHLDLAKTRGVEYFIAAIFVLLILFTFGPSVLLQILELLQILAGRHDPDHHRHRELADRLMADPRGRRALHRFTPHQRVQHWVLFAAFTALVVTGFPIKFADRPWAAWLISLMRSLTIARTLHRWAGALLLAGLVYHLLYMLHHTWRQGRRTGKGFLHACLELPMVMRWDDLRHLWQVLGYLLFLRRKRPEGDRFGPKEKFEYFGVFWGSVLLGITGLLMWANAWTTAHLTGRVLTIAALIHTFEAFLALLHVGVIHVIGVFFAPTVLPMSLAMVTGDTPTEELAEAHAGMLMRVEQQLKTASMEEVGRG